MKIYTGELEAHTLTERRVMLKTEAQARSKKTIVCRTTLHATLFAGLHYMRGLEFYSHVENTYMIISFN
jgi:hypothetical protein